MILNSINVTHVARFNCCCHCYFCFHLLHFPSDSVSFMSRIMFHPFLVFRPNRVVATESVHHHGLQTYTNTFHLVVFIFLSFIQTVFSLIHRTHSTGTFIFARMLTFISMRLSLVHSRLFCHSCSFISMHPHTLTIHIPRIRGFVYQYCFLFHFPSSSASHFSSCIRFVSFLVCCHASD